MEIEFLELLLKSFEETTLYKGFGLMNFCFRVKSPAKAETQGGWQMIKSFDDKKRLQPKSFMNVRTF